MFGSSSTTMIVDGHLNDIVSGVAGTGARFYTQLTFR